MSSIKTLAIAAAGLVAVSLTGPAVAQDMAPTWLDVAIVQVKPDQGPAFEDLIKDYMDARAAADLPTGTVYQVQMGHPNEYHIVTVAQSVAEVLSETPPMGEAEMAVWANRIQSTADNVRFFMAAINPDVGVDPPANAEFMLLRTIRVVSGMQEEYVDWVTNEYAPAWRQVAGIGHTMSSGAYGDSPQNFYHAYGFADLSVLDQGDPLGPILGERAMEQLFNAVDGIVESHEMIVARVRPDLMAQ